MIVKPGSTAYTVFEVLIGGVYDSGVVESAVATIYRNATVTAIIPTINNFESGKYLVSFVIPDNWEDYDNISASFEVEVQGFLAKAHKPVATVLDRQMTKDIWALLMLDPNRSVKHISNATIIDEGLPTEIRINLNLDEINNIVIGSRAS